MNGLVTIHSVTKSYLYYLIAYSICTAIITSFCNHPASAQTLISATQFVMVNFTGLDIKVLHYWNSIACTCTVASTHAVGKIVKILWNGTGI